MKKLLPVVLFLATTHVFAESSGGVYLGVKTGSLDIDSAMWDADTPKGVVLGYQKGSFGAEIEFNTADIDYDFLGIKSSADYKTLALYGVYRSEGDFYFKAKAGVLKQEVKTSFTTEDDTNASGGVGLGVKMGPVRLEAEYTIIETDVDFISIGANFSF